VYGHASAYYTNLCDLCAYEHARLAGVMFITNILKPNKTVRRITFWKSYCSDPGLGTLIETVQIKQFSKLLSNKYELWWIENFH
jgi:hypothetical protein